jgi:hypothetical protein
MFQQKVGGVFLDARLAPGAISRQGAVVGLEFRKRKLFLALPANQNLAA